MVRGRPPVPIEEKRRRGTLRASRIPRGAPMAGVQRLDPDLVSLDPLEVLQRVLEDGVPWLADTDAVAVALLRESLELLERAGRSGSVRDVIETQRLVISLLSQLGFSPTARARLGLAEIRTQGKLDEQRRKGPSE